MDTPADVERLQIEGWRQMSAAEKASVIAGLTNAAFQLSFAGVRARYPDASTREQFLRLAIVTLGREMACTVYPEVLQLDPR